MKNKHSINTTTSVIPAIEELLNKQIKIEATASSRYLAMSVWAAAQECPGVAAFFRAHANEEREHMMRIIDYLSEAGGEVSIPAIEAPSSSYESVYKVFQLAMEHELEVSRAILQIVEACLAVGDYTTQHFLGWFLHEQREEETLMRQALALFKHLKDSPNGLFFIDKEVEKLHHGEEK